MPLLTYNLIVLKQIGDKIDDLTGDVLLTLHQQQLVIFPDYDELGPFLRQRAKVVPLATNESQSHILESVGIASSGASIPPPPIGAGSIQTSDLDAVGGLQTFNYGDDRNANLNDLASTILTINNNVNSQNEDIVDITRTHVRHFMEEHQSLLDETALEDEETDSTAMAAQQTFQELLHEGSHSPTLTSRSGTPRAKSIHPLQHHVDHPLLQRTYDKTPEHNAAFVDTPNNTSSGSSSSLFLMRAHEEAAKASVRNKAAAKMTDTQVLSENLQNQHQVWSPML